MRWGQLRLPFFSVFNIGITHESQLWKQKGKLTVAPETVSVPPYLQDTEIYSEELKEEINTSSGADIVENNIKKQVDAIRNAFNPKFN